MKKSHGLQGLPDDTEQAAAQPGKASVQSVILTPHRQDHGLEGLLDDTEQAAAQPAPASVQSPNPRQSVMLAAGGQDRGLQGFTDDTEQTEAQRGPASVQSPNPRQSVMLAVGGQDRGLQGLTDDTEQAEAQHGPASVQSHNPRQSVMQTPPGYKQTEVGVIPEDWDVQPVAEAFEVHNQLRLPISQSVRERMVGPYPYYGPTSVQGWINEYRVEGKYALIGEDGDHFLKWRSQPMTLLVQGKFNVNNHAHLVKGTTNLTEW